jgi:hypothetical protein
MDVNLLMKSLENEKNENIFNYTTEKLNKLNTEILKTIDIDESLMDEYIKKLKYYIYLDEIHCLKEGSYLKWINITSEHLNLSKGGIFCKIKIVDSGIILICKGLTNRFFQLKFDDYLIFQRITKQEEVLLHALDILSE